MGPIETNAAVGEFTRRRFLRVSSLGSAAMVFGGAALLTACDPIELLAPDADGMRVHPAFSSRVIATTGEAVPGTDYVWHNWPDGGACFPLDDGGWSYVSNSEWFIAAEAGASFVRFDADAQVVDAGRILGDTLVNCAGGATPWGTWLSCEEYPTGGVWECDPLGASPAVKRPDMGLFSHEAAACDAVDEVIYLTEDRPDGGLYRFVPDVWEDLSSGRLDILTRPASGELTWVAVPDPSGAGTETRYQVPDTVPFAGGEGIDITPETVGGRQVVFVTKRDNRVWGYRPVQNTLEVIYDAAVNVNGVLSGVDNVETSSEGVIFVAEDGGDMQIVLVRADGSTFPVIQLTGVDGSEITGPAFDPSGTRLYFSSQRNPGRTYEVRGPWSSFTQPGPLQLPV